MKFSFLFLIGLVFAAPAFAESVAYPGPGVYRSGVAAPIAAGYPGAYMGGGGMVRPYPSGVGTHGGINTLAPLRAGARAGLRVQGGGRPCPPPPCARPRCGRSRCGGGCQVRCMSVCIRMGGCRGGGFGRCGRAFRGCRRRC